MEDNSSTATPAPADDSVQAQNPNDLATELTAEEEQAFVDETLGLKGAPKDDTTDGKTDGKVEEDSQPAEADAGESKDADSDTDATDAKDTQETTTKEEGVEDAKETKQTAVDENGVKVDDLFIEVENSEGKSVKLTYDPANPNAFLPDNFTFKDDKQLFEVLSAKQEMANLYKERSSEFAETRTKEAEKEAADNAIKERQSSWDAEITNLVGAGLLDEPKAKPGDTNFLKDPAVQKIDSVFKFMGEHNAKLRGEGKPQVTSFGTALSLMNKQESDKAAAEKLKTDNAEAKRKGALVGGTSAASGGEKKAYRAGSHTSIFDVPVDA